MFMRVNASFVDLCGSRGRSHGSGQVNVSFLERRTVESKDHQSQLAAMAMEA